MSLPERLRQATDDAHSRAERSTFVTDLLKGAGSRADYVALIGQYLPLYAALEDAVRRTPDAPLDEFADVRLERAELIRADLTALAAGADDLRPLTSTREYAEHVSALAEREPVRLLAHHYLRYLGDLSGGQAIASRVHRLYGIDRDRLRMWDFEIGKVKVYKDTYRARLETHLADPVDEQTFIDECLTGYRFAGAMFAELQRARSAEPAPA